MDLLFALRRCCSIPSLLSLNTRNWMIYTAYTRREHQECKCLIHDELNCSNGYNEFANYMLGMILRDEGKIQESMECFKKCCSLNPKNVDNIKQMGRSLFLLGKYEPAIESYLSAEKCAEITDWNIYYNLGICYMKTDNLIKAKEYITRAVQLGKSEQSYSALAKLHLIQQDFTSAITVLQSAIALYPSSTDLSVKLGLVYMKTGEFKKAFNELGTALAYDSTNAEALFTFAAEIQRHGEYDIAVAKYKIAAQSLPESAELWNNIGMCFFGKRKYVAAITCLKRANYLSPLNWLTLYNLGLLHLNTKQYASAALFLTSTAKLNFHHGQTYTLLALALKHLGDTVNCKNSFLESLKMNPNDPEACVNFASFLYSQKELDLSAKYFADFQNQVMAGSNIDKELLNMGAVLGESLQRVLSEDQEQEEQQQDQDFEQEREQGTEEQGFAGIEDTFSNGGGDDDTNSGEGGSILHRDKRDINKEDDDYSDSLV